MRAFVKLFAIWGTVLIAVVIIGVAVIVPVAVSNAKANEQKTATTVAQQQNAYSLLDTSAGQVAYGLLVENNWSGFCRQLSVVSSISTHEGVTTTTIRRVDSDDNIVLMSSETSGNVYTIGICDRLGTYKAIASFEPAEGYSVPVDLGSGKPTLYLTPIGAIYLGQTVGHFVSGTYE
jgi:hypothetical protein